MTKTTNDLYPDPRPVLIPLAEACRIRGISERTWYNDKSLLPTPVPSIEGRRRSHLRFVESDVYQLTREYVTRHQALGTPVCNPALSQWYANKAEERKAKSSD